MENTTQDSSGLSKKEALIEHLIDIRRRILDLAGKIPPEKQGQVFLGEWSARELLAHLAGWDVTNIQAAREVMTGKLPGFYAYIDKDWASYNARLVAEYGRADFTELIELVTETHRQLIAYLFGQASAELWKDRGIRARGWKVTIGRLLEAEIKDEEVHYQQLSKFVESFHHR